MVSQYVCTSILFIFSADVEATEEPFVLSSRGYTKSI
jgi:hypothetical protein